MAELVGGALLSGFISVLFDRMATQEVLNFSQGKKFLAKLLDELKIRLLSANKLMKDAEVKQLTDEDVRKWLDELSEVIYKADHVMYKINTEALQHKVEEGDQPVSAASKLLNFMPKSYNAFDNSVKSEIGEILGRLDFLLRQKDELGLREGVHENGPQRLPASLVDACDVYGRDAEKEALVELLLSDGNSGHRISVIPIVGMGGIGKTTLTQLVYNDSRVQDHFALMVWVTVSEEFDLFKLTRMIIEAITSRKCDILDLYQLQNGLKKELIGKRFLLAMHISGEFSFVSDGCFYLDDITSKTRYLLHKKCSKGMIKSYCLSRAKCLSTLLALPLPLEYGFKSILTDTIVSELLLKVGGCLKVLSLSQSNIVELATNPIGDQKYLKYLDLSYTKVKELPSSIGTLYNLQTLLLSNCKNLTQIADEPV